MLQMHGNDIRVLQVFFEKFIVVLLWKFQAILSSHYTRHSNRHDSTLALRTASMMPRKLLTFGLP